MSYPADVTQVVVNGLFSAAQPAGAVPTGKVEFWPTTVLVDAGTKQLVEPGVVTATLDGAGAFSVTLMATDDPDLTPTGWGYWVRETVDGYPVRVYIIQLPAAGTPFKLGNLQHLAVVALSPYLLASQLGQANGVASLDGAGQVPATQLANAGSGGGGGVPLTRSINTTAPLTGGGNLTADRTLAVSDATAGAKGVVQLAGDLSGTAAAPTVPGLAGKSATGHGHVEGDVTSLVTDLELQTTPPLNLDCGECRLCIDACPTGALDEPGTLDANKCLSYWTQSPRPIPEDMREALGDQVYGCDICQDVCPWNRGVERRRADEPAAEATVSLVDWLEAEEHELRLRYARLYVPRNDGRWLKRNALVAAGNVGGDAERAAVERQAAGDDELLAEHARWALERLEERRA